MDAVIVAVRFKEDLASSFVGVLVLVLVLEGEVVFMHFLVMKLCIL